MRTNSDKDRQIWFESIFTILSERIVLAARSKWTSLQYCETPMGEWRKKNLAISPWLSNRSLNPFPLTVMYGIFCTLNRKYRREREKMGENNFERSEYFRIMFSWISNLTLLLRKTLVTFCHFKPVATTVFTTWLVLCRPLRSWCMQSKNTKRTGNYQILRSTWKTGFK